MIREKRSAILVLVLLLLAMGVASVVGGDGDALELFVSPAGNDADAGTRAKPFKTLERARDAARVRKRDRSVIVWLQGGVYELEKTFELTAEDSGSDKNPVLYRGWPGEEVRIVGGKVVTGWKQVTDEGILTQLVAEARGKVFQADLKALGISSFGEVKGGGLELFFEDRPMTLARWPNDDFISIAGLVGPEDVSSHGRKGSKTGKFLYEGDRPRRWGKENDIWVHGYWFWDWSDQRQKVASIDVDRHVISIKPPYHHYGYRVGQWFYALNILAELDTPGEWYLDRETGVLTFWPPAPVDAGRPIVSVLDTLVRLTDASHVTLQEILFEASRGTAVTIRGGTQARIAGCVLRNLGGWGVEIEGGTGNGVSGCDIYQTGKGGIGLDGSRIYGGGDLGIGRRELTPAGHFADNNHIHHYGRWERMYQSGISISGVGNRATHNLIHNAPHMAIKFSGNDHLIAFNEIHHVCEEANDAGAIYAGRDWTMRGTVIRYNYLHDINGFRGRGCVGVYLDDMFCGTTIFGNIFYQVRRAAFIGGGRDNIVENNIFVDCKPAVHVDARGLTWAKGVVPTIMMERLNAMPYKSDLWRKRYPKLLNILEDDPGAPKGNVIARNICYGGKWDELNHDSGSYVTFTNNLVNQDPGFTAAPPKSFALRDDSPAYAVGFEPVPFEKIGLYKDTYRAELPQE